jgi:hypothetical protein
MRSKRVSTRRETKRRDNLSGYVFDKVTKSIPGDVANFALRASVADHVLPYDALFGSPVEPSPQQIATAAAVLVDHLADSDSAISPGIAEVSMADSLRAAFRVESAAARAPSDRVRAQGRPELLPEMYS